MSSAPTLAPAMPFGQAAEHLKVKLRPDLVVQPQFYEGMTHYVIKDPLALKYFRFKIEEYFLLQQFDGKQTPPGRQEGVRAEVPAADDLDRGPDPVRRPAPRGGDRPDRQPRAGQGPDPPPPQEPLEEGLAVPRQHPLHQDPDHRPRAAPDGDVPVLPLDLHPVLHHLQRRA